MTAERKTDIESDTETFRDQDIYCVCATGVGGWEGIDMMMMRERSGAGAVMVCPTSDRQSPALFNALQISLPCAL